MHNQKQELISDNRITRMTRWECDDIKLGHAITSFQNLTSFSASNPTDVVRVHYGLKGNYSFYCKQLNRTFDLIGSHHNIMCTNGFDMVVYNKTLELKTFGIQFSKASFIHYTQDGSDIVKRFAEKIVRGQNVVLSEYWGAIDPTIQIVIQQVIDGGYVGDLQKTFLLSKSLELLVLSAEAYNVANQKQTSFIKTKTDKEKIIAVRDLVNERAHCPPNLSAIAKEVGLNEYKLKRGFKEMFNTTVFGYLTEQRLYLAQQYLLDTQKTAAEVSHDLGYATPQYFNNAFKRKFGVTPEKARKNP